MESIIEEKRSIPVKECYDVVVAGAGSAGVSAALAAARQGASVCLLDKGNMLGGLSTMGMVGIFLPLCDGYGRKLIGGIGEEFLQLALQHNRRSLPDYWAQGAGNYGPAVPDAPRYHVECNPQIFALLLEELVAKENIHILLDTRLCAVAKEGESISALIVENKAGRVAIGCGAVVDATGDCDVCSLAGEEVEVFTDNRLQSWYYAMEYGRLRLNMSGGMEDMHAYDGTDPADITAMNINGRRQILQRLRKLWADQHLVELAALPSLAGFRMTRRLVGEATLAQDQQRRYFEDSVGMFGDWRKEGPVYYLPFGALHGRCENLLAAGRCISCDKNMLDIARTTPASAMSGQAAGLGAAMISHGGYGSIGALPIHLLQQELLGAGALIDQRFATE